MPSAGNTMLRGQFTDLFASRLPYIDEILFENFDAPTLTYPEVFNVRDSMRAYEEITGVTGFSQFSKKPEAQKVETDKMLQAYDKRFTHETWGKMALVSFEAMEDDIDGVITSILPPMARAARNTIETELYSLYNNAFGTTTTPDGQALCANSHPLVGGGTFDNLITGDFAQGTLEDALNIYSGMKDERGQLIDAMGEIILAHPNSRWRIEEVLKSQLRSDTADNAVNVINQLGLRPVYSKYLTDEGAWFLLSSPDKHRNIIYWRRDPFSDSSLDFDTRSMKIAMFFRLSHGSADWRGTVGSAGD